MKNNRFIVGVLAVLLTFGLVLAGCASNGAGTNGTVEEDPVAAERLASDINVIEAGKAVVNGATVTLTGEVRVEKDLTVPEGVTLDLTKERETQARRQRSIDRERHGERTGPRRPR
jgi:hypothetical protein